MVGFEGCSSSVELVVRAGLDQPWTSRPCMEGVVMKTSDVCLPIVKIFKK